MLVALHGGSERRHHATKIKTRLEASAPPAWWVSCIMLLPVSFLLPSTLSRIHQYRIGLK